jgi:hypothetical protein
MHNVTPQGGFTEIEHSTVDRMEALLRRYPAIDAAEQEELLRFMQKGRIMDKGVLSSRDGMGEKLRAFEAEHASALGLGPLHWVMIGIGVLAFVAICWLIADIGA